MNTQTQSQSQSFEEASSAPNLLQIGVDAMKDRGASRDNEGERSMAKTVKAFNAFTGRDLSEEEGWLFMVCLKQARSMNGAKKIADDYVDGSAYFALQGECALRHQAVAEDNEYDEAINHFLGAEEEPPALVSNKQIQDRLARLQPGNRVTYRFINSIEIFKGTIYVDDDDGSLRVRSGDDPLATYCMASIAEIKRATS